MTLTTRGIALAASAVVLVAAGFTLGYAELVVLGSTGALAVLCGTTYAFWQPRLVVRRRAEPERVTRGEASLVTLTVSNSSRLVAATLIAYDRCGPAQVAVPLLRLRPGRDRVVSYPIPTRRRGVVDIGPLRVTRTDPLGLVSVARLHGGTSRIWVHPRSYPLAAVPAGITRSMDGRFDRVPHGSITFATLREYVVGDELRHVHWRTSARVGELMVREHLDTSLPRIVILLDNRRSSWPDPEAFESACEAAASVVAAAAREDLAVSLSSVCDEPGPAIRADGARAGGWADGTRPGGWADAPGPGTGPGRARADAGQVGPAPVSTPRPGRRTARDLLDRLAEASLHPDTGSAVKDAATRLRQRRIGDTLVYLTGAGGVADLGLVAGLRGAYPAVVVGVLGADTPAPSTMQGVLVLDAADGPEFASAWDGVRSW